MFYSEHDKPMNLFVRKTTNDIVFTYLSLPHEHVRSASLLVHHENETIHKMAHCNFTMFRCEWGSELATEEKMVVFRGMTDWLAAQNKTLSAYFVDTDDFLAWNIAQYNYGTFF